MDNRNEENAGDCADVDVGDIEIEAIEENFVPHALHFDPVDILQPADTTKLLHSDIVFTAAPVATSHGDLAEDFTDKQSPLTSNPIVNDVVSEQLISSDGLANSELLTDVISCDDIGSESLPSESMLAYLETADSAETLGDVETVQEVPLMDVQSFTDKELAEMVHCDIIPASEESDSQLLAERLIGSVDKNDGPYTHWPDEERIGSVDKDDSPNTQWPDEELIGSADKDDSPNTYWPDEELIGSVDKDDSPNTYWPDEELIGSVDKDDSPNTQWPDEELIGLVDKDDSPNTQWPDEELIGSVDKDDSPHTQWPDEELIGSADKDDSPHTQWPDEELIGSVNKDDGPHTQWLDKEVISSADKDASSHMQWSDEELIGSADKGNGPDECVDLMQVKHDEIIGLKQPLNEYITSTVDFRKADDDNTIADAGNTIEVLEESCYNSAVAECTFSESVENDTCPASLMYADMGIGTEINVSSGSDKKGESVVTDVIEMPGIAVDTHEESLNREGCQIYFKHAHHAENNTLKEIQDTFSVADCNGYLYGHGIITGSDDITAPSEIHFTIPVELATNEMIDAEIATTHIMSGLITSAEKDEAIDIASVTVDMQTNNEMFSSGMMDTNRGDDTDGITDECIHLIAEVNRIAPEAQIEVTLQPQNVCSDDEKPVSEMSREMSELVANSNKVQLHDVGLQCKDADKSAPDDNKGLSLSATSSSEQNIFSVNSAEGEAMSTTTAAMATISRISSLSSVDETRLKTHIGNAEHTTDTNVDEFELCFAEVITNEMKDHVENTCKPQKELKHDLSDQDNRGDSEWVCSLQKAQQEWTEVQQATEDGAFLKAVKDSKMKCSKSAVTYDGLRTHLEKTDFDNFKVQPSLSRRGIAFIFNLICGSPKMKQSLLDSRRQLFCIAKCELNNQDVMHIQTLQTIYHKLIDDCVDCPRYGSHWERIGFQGTDPATDLRGLGMLGLLQLLYLVSEPQTAQFARNAHHLSLHDQQHFSFACMSITVSRIALQALRDDILNKECNKRKDVLSVLNDFYVGTFYWLVYHWRNNNCTIHDGAHAIKAIEMTARQQPSKMCRTASSFLHCKSSQSDTCHNKVNDATDNEAPLQFYDVCDETTTSNDRLI